MKVDMVYTIHYIPHPWDAKLRKDGIKAYCLCREIRMPTEPGLVHGAFVSYEPVALFNLDSEGNTFQRFVDAEGIKSIEISRDMKDLIESERNLGASRLADGRAKK